MTAGGPVRAFAAAAMLPAALGVFVACRDGVVDGHAEGDAAPAATQPEPHAVRQPPTPAPRRRLPEPENGPAVGEVRYPVPDTGKELNSAVPSGLRWLRDQQGEDGLWRDPATTGLVLLAFLGAGETHQSGSSRDRVKRGLEALRRGQDAEGCLAPSSSLRRLRDHAIAGLALCEAYGMTGSKRYREPAERALAFALNTRGPSGAWHLPSPDEAQIDVETTAQMATLVKSVELCELGADPSVLSQIVGALDTITDASGRVRGTVRTPTPLSDDAATAMALHVRALAGRRPWNDDATRAGVEALKANPPSADTADLRYAHFAHRSMVLIGTAERLKPWMPHLTAFVAVPQRTDGPFAGTWDPPGGGDDEARLWTTAYHLFARELFYGPVGHAFARTER